MALVEEDPDMQSNRFRGFASIHCGGIEGMSSQKEEFEPFEPNVYTMK
jgi:hypothetical protein